MAGTSQLRTIGLQASRSRDARRPLLARLPSTPYQRHVRLLTRRRRRRIPRASQRAESSGVATLLYTEIAWCFALELLVLKAPAEPLKLAGASLIVLGAAVYAALS